MLERFETDAGRLEIILHYLRKDTEINDQQIPLYAVPQPRGPTILTSNRTNQLGSHNLGLAGLAERLEYSNCP